MRIGISSVVLIYVMPVSVRRRVRALGALAALVQNRAPRRALGPDDWHELLDVAVELRVEPALRRGLRQTGLVAPDDVAQTLHRLALLNTTRNLRFRRMLVEATAALNRAGIEPLLFKGSLWLAAEGWDRPSERSMVDLDLAIPAECQADASQALQSIGYIPNAGRPFEHPHELPFHRPGAPGPIELHVELGSDELAAVLPVNEAWPASHELVLAGARARGLSPTDQVLHNILHAAVQDLNHAVAGLPLRQLVVLTDLVRRGGESIEWQEISWRFAQHGLGEILGDHLWLAHRLAGMPLPAALDPGRGARLHELAAVVGFGLGWPPHLLRNVHYAFGAAYLDSLYDHRGRRAPLALARMRHAARLIRSDGRGILAATLARRD